MIRVPLDSVRFCEYRSQYMASLVRCCSVLSDSTSSLRHPDDGYTCSFAMYFAILTQVHSEHRMPFQIWLEKDKAQRMCAMSSETLPLFRCESFIQW